MKKSFVIKCGSLCQELANRISEEGIEFSNIEISGGVMRIYFSDYIKDPSREILDIKRIFEELSKRSYKKKVAEELLETSETSEEEFVSEEESY
ncbi:MAG: hypothetical protein JHC19_06470 [Desulfurococcaceae archaeon]|jgi:hypothetical protein|nr:hypothetical protein [Desulfurococcaceae archaeon]